MSQVGQQLAQLRSNQSVPKSGPLTKPSVLYSAKESASYDLDHVYFLAIQGYKRLQSVDDEFTILESLINPQFKGIARGTLSQSENDQMDTKLRSGLLLLSSYFLHEECLQVIEYLLRNYLIHQYLPNETTVWFLQYHSFPLYTRLLQNIVDDHRQQNDMLGFLYTSISRGDIVTRSQIVKQMAVDYRILKHLVDFTHSKVNSDANKKPKEFVINVVVQSMSANQISNSNQRKPDNLSFLYSILQELQQNSLAQNYIENIRGGLGKLIQTLLQGNKEEHFSFIYLVLTSYLKGSKQWLSTSQLESIAEIIMDNFSRYKANKLIWEVMTILSTVLQSEKLLRLIMSNIDDEDLNASSTLSSNQYLLQQGMKLFLRDKQCDCQKLLLKWTLNILQQQSSKIFVDALVHELKNASNLELAELVHSVCVAYLSESKVYKQYFSEPPQQLTIDNVESFASQKIQTLSVSQLQSLANQIHLLMVRCRTKIPQLLLLLQDVLKCQSTKFPHSQIYTIQQFELALAVQQKLTKSKTIIHIAYVLCLQERNEFVKFSALSQVCISTHLKLDDAVKQFSTMDQQQENSQQWLQSMDLFHYLLDFISNQSDEKSTNHQLLYLVQALGFKLNVAQTGQLINAVQKLLRQRTLVGVDSHLLDQLLQVLMLKYQEQCTHKIAYLGLCLTIGRDGLQVIMQALVAGQKYLMFDLVRIFYQSLSGELHQQHNNTRIIILALVHGLAELGLFLPIINHFMVTTFFMQHHFNSEQQKIYMTLLSKFVELNKIAQPIKALPLDSDRTISLDHALIKQLMFKAEKSKTQLQSSSQALIQFVQSDLPRREAFISLAILIMSQPNPTNEKSIFILQGQIIAKCLIFLQKSDQKQIKKFTTAVELLIKDNPLFGLSTISQYFKLLSVSDQPSYDLFASVIMMESSSESQMNDIIQDTSFDAVPTKLKSQIILNVSRCKSDQHIYIGTFDVEIILEAYRTSVINNHPYQQTEYLKNILVNNITQIREEQLTKTLQLETHNYINVLQLVELCKAFIVKKDGYKLPLHEQILNILVRYVEQQGEEFDCRDHQTYQTLYQIIDLQALMMKYDMKKQVFQSVVEFFESRQFLQFSQESLASTAPTEISKQLNGLLLIKIITQSLNKHVPKFFHNARYSYFLAATLLLIQNYLESTHAQPSESLLPYFEGFKLDELWLIIYLMSRYEFNSALTSFLFKHLKSLDASYYLLWVNALGETLIFSQIKDARLRDKKGLKSDVRVKTTSKAKYNVFQLGKIVSKSLHVIKSQASLKSNTIKRQIFTTLNFFGVLFGGLKPSLIGETQQHHIIHTIKSLHKIEKWYSDSKLATLALNKKSQLVSLLNMEFLLNALNTYATIDSIQKLLLYALNQQITTTKVKITPKFLAMSLVYVDHISSGANKNDAIMFQHTTSLQQLIRRRPFAEHLMTTHPESSKSLFDFLLGLLHSTKVSLEHKIKLVDIISVAVKFDRYLFLPHMTEILSATTDLMLAMGKDEKSEYEVQSQVERMSSHLNKKFNNVLSVGEYKLLSQCLVRLIEGFGGTISKENLVNVILVLTSFNDEDCMTAIIGNLEPRILIAQIPSLVGGATAISSLSVQRLCRFLTKLFTQMSVEVVSLHYVDLTTQIITLLNYPKQTFVASETDNAIFIVDVVENEIIVALTALILKMNDIQLKKSFNMLIQWAKGKDDVGGYNFKEFNKLTFFKIVSRLSNQLGPFFTKYFGYIFESLLNFFNDFHGIFSQKARKLSNFLHQTHTASKRPHEEPDMFYKLYILQCRHALQCVEQMCVNDKDDFLDTEKFEKLAQPLALILDCPKVNDFEKVNEFIEDWISSAIIAIFQLVNDDFKWKTLHYHILQVLQKHSISDNAASVAVCVAILTLLSKLVDILEDRYTVLVNDLVPYLHNLSQSQTQSEELQTLITQLVTKLSVLTGEEIGASLRSARIK